MKKYHPFLMILIAQICMVVLVFPSCKPNNGGQVLANIQCWVSENKQTVKVGQLILIRDLEWKIISANQKRSTNRDLMVFQIELADISEFNKYSAMKSYSENEVHTAVVEFLSKGGKLSPEVEIRDYQFP